MSKFLDDLQAKLLDRHLDPAEVARSARGLASVLVVTDGPFDGNWRVGVYADHRDTIELLADGIADDSGLATLVASLQAPGRAVHRGEWNAAWAMPPGFVWVPKPLRLWDGDGKALARLEGEWLWTPGDAVKQAAITSVTAWVASDWGEIGVRVDCKRDGDVSVAKVDNAIAGIDPTYDGLNLLADAAWARSLGRSLADALGVPYIDAT